MPNCANRSILLGLSLLLAMFGLLLPAVLAQDPAAVPSAEEGPSGAVMDRQDAIQQGLQRLLEFQELYQPDDSVGQLSSKQLEAWRGAERERLTKLRMEAGANRSEWPYEGVYRVGAGEIPAGYRVGGSAIVCLALLGAPGFSQDAPRQAAVERSLGFILTLLAEDPSLAAGPKRGYDVRGWGHTYALELILALLREPQLAEPRAELLRGAVRDLLARLALNQVPGGGWNYASDQAHSPFQTGATLLALYEAKRQGFEFDGGLVEAALGALERGRDADTGAFAYAGPGKEPMHASAARSALAELCLLRAGRSDFAALERAIAGFFDGWEHLLARKGRQGTHAGRYNIAPYYFFFGHTYAARAIEALPEERRPERRSRLHALLAQTREADGTWNDRIFPRSASYGTAMALLALLAPDLPPAPEWKAAAVKPE